MKNGSFVGKADLPAASYLSAFWSLFFAFVIPHLYTLQGRIILGLASVFGVPY